MMPDIRGFLRLYLVTDPFLCSRVGLEETVRHAVAGGVTMVQLRDKHATTADRISMARMLKCTLAGTGVPLVINDDVEAAVIAEADGVHIGQSDMSAADARAILGPEKILGLSCESTQSVHAANPAIVDYLGLGPVFGTATKTDHKAPIGFDGLAGMVALSPLPNVAIGGLKAKHARSVFECGADGMAVVSAICGQPDATAAARAFSIKEAQQ